MNLIYTILSEYLSTAEDYVKNRKKALEYNLKGEYFRGNVYQDITREYLGG